MECVIFQGFLQKTPPLDKLIVTWKKRWFVLSQKDPFNPRSVELTYYTESDQAEKRGTIDMASITRIHPSPSKAKGHIFSIEVKDKKIMLKADDAKTKSIWIAKLYEFAGQGHNYHVTVPYQPMATYNEGLLQLSRSESQISILPPTSSNPILDIPYSQIRRFGYQVVLENYDVIWCELCHCKPNENNFCFFVVASGMDRAMLIANDLKTKIEKDTGRFLIMEEDKHPECTYISRNHYGCPPYPKLGRDRILHEGIVKLEATRMVTYSIKRRMTDPIGPSIVNVSNERRNTVQTLLSAKTPSPRPSPNPSRSPSPSRAPPPSATGGLTLQDISRRKSQSGAPPGSTSDPTAEYTGKTLTAFDQGRRSDGSYLSLSDSSKTLSNLKNKRPSEPNFSSMDRRRMGNKISLSDLNGDRGKNAGAPDRFFPSKDSGIGTSADLVLDQDGRTTSPFHSPSPCPSPSPSASPTPYSRTRKISGRFDAGYDHLGPPTSPGPPRTPSPHIAYDHLSPTESTGSTNCPPVPPRSGVSLGDPYVDV